MKGQSVTCPCGCGHTFIPTKDVSTPRSRKGAKYAEKWTKLQPKHLKLLAWGISGLWASTPLSKDEIYRGFNGTSVDALNPRISEFWKLDIVERIVTEPSKHADENPYKDALVKYKLNVARAVQLLNNGGRLK